MTDSLNIFDKKLYDIRKNRFAKDFHKHSFLFEIAAREMISMLDFHEGKFEDVLEIGSKDGYFSKSYAEEIDLKFNKLTSIESSGEMNEINEHSENLKQMAGEIIDFPQESFDFIFSLLEFHWTNNVPLMFEQIKYALKDGGLFIMSVFGPKTLASLKKAMIDAEAEFGQGHALRFAPCADIKEIAGLAQKVGFKEPVAHSQTLKVHYDSLKECLGEVQKMCQANILRKRSKSPLSQKLLNRIEEKMLNEDRVIEVEYEIIYLTCWKN